VQMDEGGRLQLFQTSMLTPSMIFYFQYNLSHDNKSSLIVRAHRH